MKSRVLYIAGPGDVAGTFRHWIKNEADPSEMSVTYSSQFFDICRHENLNALVISSHHRKDQVYSDEISVIHVPAVLQGATGVFWHASQIIYGLKLLSRAATFKPDIVVVATGTHWFMLYPLFLFGVKVIPTLHCTLWAKNKKIGFLTRLINKLNAEFFFKKCFCILSISNEITRQVRRLLGGKLSVPVIHFFPTYKPDQFTHIRQRISISNQLRHILYVGRIEKNKGVVDLLLAVKLLSDEVQMQLHFCGAGSFLEGLRRLAESEGVGDLTVFHGHMNRFDLHNLFQMMDVLVVPTTADFVEGFNKVVVEGILGGVPTITTDICPATEYLKGSVVLFEAGNVEDLASKIRVMLFDQNFRERLQISSKAHGGYFYNIENGWAAAFGEVVRCIADKRKPLGKNLLSESPILP